MRGALIVLAAWVALLLGCAREAVIEVADFDLHSGGRVTRVHLPGDFHSAADARTPFSLTSHVTLPPELRGRDATLVVGGLLGLYEVSINGAVSQPLEDSLTPNATQLPHAFAIPRETTRRGEIDLELRFRYDSISASRFLDAPRISATPRGDTMYRWARRINADGSNVAISMLLAIGLAYGTLFILDRRRTFYAWFAGFALFAGLFTRFYIYGLDAFGGHSFTVAWSMAFIAGWIGVRFQYAYFDFPAPAWLRYAPWSLIVPWALYHDSFTAPRNHYRIVGVLCVAALTLLLLTCIRAVRARRRNAPFVLGYIIVYNLVVAPDVVHALHVGDPTGGLRFLGLGYLAVAIVNIVLLGRDHRVLGQDLEQRVIELDTANVELRRQIAERSRELSEALANMSSGKSKLLPGDIVDERYRVLKKLGEGGMGAVYEVERLRDCKHFAMKVLLDTSKSGALARFAREGQIAAEIAHPNVLGVVDVGTSQQGLFVVSELVDSGSLEEFRQRFGDRDWALPLLKQIASGVAALHRAGVVHRDLKPGNVLLGSDGRPRIADFGIAALRDNHVDALGATRDQLTAAGALLGTPIYMAPELARGAENASVASDVFAFGVLAYEMLTGKLPFASPPVLDALVGRTSDPPRKSGNSAIDKFVMDALALDPKKRPSLGGLAVVGS
jgi:hypothetical protein